jgi:hypothetical protein
MENDILQEVWRHRDEFAKRCNYDLDVMAEALAQIEREPQLTLVDKRKKTAKKGLERPPRSRKR